MTTEEFQKIMLDELKGLKDNINGLKEEQGKISKVVNSIYEQTMELTEFRSETKENFANLSNKVDGLENKLDDIEVNNANRHLDITGSINELREDFNAIEIVTSKNWNDIAKLKAVK